MSKIAKGLLAGCVVCLMPMNVQAVSDDIWSDLTDRLETVEPIIEETEEETEVTRTGTVVSTYSSVTVVWPIEEKANWGYRVFVKTTDGYVKVGETEPEVNWFLLEEIEEETLKPGTSYTVKVVALRRKGKGKKVLSYRLIRTSTLPEAPEFTKAKRRTGKKAIVKWKSLADVSGYELQVGTRPCDEFQTVDYFGRNKSKTTIYRLQKGKKYYVRIRAYKTVTGGRIYGEWSKLKKV